MVLSEATHIDINRKKHKPDIAMLTILLIRPAGVLTVKETATETRGRCRFSVGISFNRP